MTVLKIGKETFEPVEIIPIKGDNPPAHTADLDHPFSDEVCIKIDKPGEEYYNFYVVRLAAGCDLSALKAGEKASLEDPVDEPAPSDDEATDADEEAEEPLKLTGKVVWFDDEQEKQSYNLASLDLEFGYPVSKDGDTTFKKVNPAEHGIDADKLRAEILKALDLKPGMPITWKIFVDRFRQSRQLDNLFADQAFKVGVLELSWGKEVFDPGETPTIKFRLVVMPPPKEVIVEFVDVTTEGGTLPPDKEKAIRAELGKEWADWFKKPLTAKNIGAGAEAFSNYFKLHTSYALALPDVQIIPDGRPIITPPVMPEINEAGQLVLKTRLRPLPTSVEIVRVDVGEDGKPEGEEQKFPASAARVAPPKVLSDENIEKYLVDLRKAYEADIRYVRVDARPMPDGKLVIRLLVFRPPTRIETDFDLPGIDDAVIQANLKKWFDPERKGYFTQTSIEEGLKAFREWCEKEGIHLRPGEPDPKVKGRVLTLSAHAARMTTFEVLYIDQSGEKKRLFLDRGKGKPEVNDAGPYGNLIKHFRDRVYGSRMTVGRLLKKDRFNEEALREALGEIAAAYPSVQAIHDVTPIDPADPESNHVRVILHDRSLSESFPVIRLNASGGATIMSGETGLDASEYSANLGATVIGRDGTQTSGNVGVTHYSQETREAETVDHGRVDLGFSQKLLWVRPDGTTLLYGGQLSIPTSGDAFPYVVAPYAEGDIPFERFSHWGYLVGGNSSLAWDGPVDGAVFWQNLYGGLRYHDRYTRGRATIGPVAGNRGVYGELRASGDHTRPLSDDGKWRLGLHGLTRTQAGGVPEYRQASAADVLSGPGLLPFGLRSPYAAAVGADVEYTIFDNVPLVGNVTAGVHAAAKCVGEDCVVAGGVYLGTAGLRIGPEAGIGPDGPYANPFGIVMSW